MCTAGSCAAFLHRTVSCPGTVVHRLCLPCLVVGLCLDLVLGCSSISHCCVGCCGEIVVFVVVVVVVVVVEPRAAREARPVFLVL